MPVGLFTCPKTKLPVPTGENLDELGWKALGADSSTKETAYLAGTKPKAQ